MLQKIKRYYYEKGFTLFELIIGVSIVVGLAVTALVSVNPAKRLADGRDTKRWVDAQALFDAEILYRADRGLFVPSLQTLMPDTYYMIGEGGGACPARTAGNECDVSLAPGCVDLAELVNAGYLKSIPVSPQASAGIQWSSNETGYYIRRSSADSIAIGACDAENTSFIAVNAPSQTLPPLPPPPPPPDPNLIVHLPFDDGSGTTAVDATGNGNNGTLVNGPVWTTGKIGTGALNFDGVNDRVGLGTLDISGSAITLLAWINPANLAACPDCRIISKAVGTLEQDHYWMLSPGSSGGQIKLRFRLKTGGITSTFFASTATLADGNWYHVAATYDGITMRLYQDGVEVGNTPKTGIIDTNSTVQAWIGDNPPTAGSKPWSGTIDDVRIYNRALSATEIQTLYSAGDTAPPTRSNASPSGTLAVGTTATTISLTTNENATCQWNTSGGITYGGAGMTPFSTTGGTSHSQTITGLVNGGSYAYYVRCQDYAPTPNANTTDFPISFSVDVPDTQAPSTPGTPTFSSITDKQMTVSWTASTDNKGVTEYRIYRCSGGGCTLPVTPTFTVSGTPPAATYPDTGLSPSTSYTYAIDARDAALNVSPQSFSSSATTLADTFPPTISNPQPSGTLPFGTINTTISVTTNENATCKYNLSTDTTYALMTGTFTTTGGTSHSELITGLTNGSSRTYFVRCQDGLGNINTTGTPISFSVSASAGGTAVRSPSYVENICNTNPDVFFCEDFEGEDITNYGNNNCQSTYRNPGIENYTPGSVSNFCWAGGGSYQNSTIPTPMSSAKFSTVTRQPSGTIFDPNNSATNRVWRVSKSTGFTDIVTGINTGTGSGGVGGWIKKPLIGTGGQDFYVRFQVYWDPTHSWPADLDNKTVFTLPRDYVDLPSAPYETGMYIHQDYSCSGLGNFNNVPTIRYTNNFGQFPYTNEYCPPLATGANPDGVHAPRMALNRWYTFEYHIKLANDTTGILEMWIDGIPTYFTQRQTCPVSGAGCVDQNALTTPNCMWDYTINSFPPGRQDCSMQYLLFMSYMNPVDPQTGYLELDNLVISRSYIGLPN